MLKTLTVRALCVVAAALAGCSSSGPAPVEVTGAGASFIFPLMSRWSADYSQQVGARINYQSIGSSGGIAQIRAGTVDFGSSDAPLSSEDLASAGLIQFPLVIGGVVPVINVPGVGTSELKLTGPVLADIFLGAITKWNDPAIADLNEGLALPDNDITVVHRSDGSGTTFNFANYLSKVSPEWKSRVGEGTSLQWPIGLGGKGNEGVAAYVKQIENAIGYVELSYVLQNSMSYALLRNQAGQFVAPSTESFAAAAAGADWGSAGDFGLIITDAPGAASWPIAATNFVLMRQQPRDAERARVAREFFTWTQESGRDQALALDYVPLPEALVQQIRAYWSKRLN